jgi:hypothetical protein
VEEGEGLAEGEVVQDVKLWKETKVDQVLEEVEDGEEDEGEDEGEDVEDWALVSQQFMLKLLKKGRKE